MTRLYGFELKKILQKKAFWITLILGLILNCTVASSNSIFDVYEYPDGSKITGWEMNKLESAECGKLSGRVVDDDFLNEIRDNITDFALAKKYVTEQDIEKIKSGNFNEGEYYVADGEGNLDGNPIVGLDNAAEQLGIADAWYFIMDAIDDNSKLLTVNGDEFQKLFKKNIEFPKEQKDYWEKTAANIPEPIVYTYGEPLIYFLDSGFFFVWMMFILIAVSLSGTFADERSLRMDALIISSKHGKIPVAIAKLLAGFTVSVVAVILTFATTFVMCIINHGKIYTEAALQMFLSKNPWGMTMGEATIKLFVCTLIVSLLFTAVTVFLSEIMNSTAAMGIQMGVLMISFFNPPFKNQMISDLWRLRPTHFVSGWLDNFSIFNFGTLQLNCMQMAEVIYTIGTVFFAVIAIALYKRYQVKSR